MTTVVAGTYASPFELTGMDGRLYRLDQALRRGPVLTAFFKASCPTCQYAFPFIARIYQQFRPQGSQVRAISQVDTQAGKRFAREYGVSFPILIACHAGYALQGASGPARDSAYANSGRTLSEGDGIEGSNRRQNYQRGT
jgi:peroxiredoxin